MKALTPKVGIMVIILFLILSVLLLVVKRNERTSTSSSASRSPATNAASAQKTGGEIGDYYAGPSLPPVSTSSATPVPKSPDIKTYIYTGAKTLSSTTSKLELESAASAEAVTSWYKKKIEDSKFNAKSYSQTSTGGTILNKLSAAKPGEKLDITIKKDQNASKVLITVDRS